jgi:ubiquinone/menaquinone biosynthesis C-methylase UbiE
MTNVGPQNLNDEVKSIWDGNAPFWDEKMAEGNAFHLALVAPSAERLLAIQPGERVIEFACGNGQFSRRLAELGATVDATDFAPGMIDAAQRRTSQRPEIAAKITFDVLDAADETDLARLGDSRFDAAVCNMAIMDMAEIEPMFAAARRALRPNGRFVFTLCHPCFNHSGIAQFMEQSDRDGEIVCQTGIKITSYIRTGNQKGLAIAGQPYKQWYFNRTLSDLLNTCFAAGFVLDGLEEPSFPFDGPDTGRFHWNSIPEIPPVLAARLRPA